MNKLSTFGLLAILLMGATAQADLPGAWTGTVLFSGIGEEPDPNDTEEVTFSVFRLGNHLYVDNLDAQILAMPDLLTRFDVNGDELYWDDQLVGSHTPDRLTYDNGSGDFTQLSLQPDGKLYVLAIHGRGGSGYKYEGVVGRVPEVLP